MDPIREDQYFDELTPEQQSFVLRNAVVWSLNYIRNHDPYAMRGGLSNNFLDKPKQPPDA